MQNNTVEPGSNHIDRELIREKVKSLVDNISGVRKLPKPPISNGITTKKIISKPCDAISMLYKVSLTIEPVVISSIRIRTLILRPNIPVIKLKQR